MKIKYYKKYGGPEWSGQESAWDPFSIEVNANGVPTGTAVREFVAMPENALDWCFYWHDVRYKMSEYCVNEVDEKLAVIV
ncbi:MAG: hypothetical protein JW976_05100 [Syntrophaceae bacterium]|nr:hypothetical protein [Syntrophaceae bacterium]